MKDTMMRWITVGILATITAWGSAPSNGSVCVATTTQWAPFNMEIDGKPAGIGIDYWNEIAKRMGVTTRFEIKSQWSDVLKSIKERTCDVTIATQMTQSREAYAKLSKPYADYPVMIVTRMDVGFIDSLDQIVDQTVALPVNYATSEAIVEKHPKIKALYVNNIDEALQAVSLGRAYATVGILPVVAYKITKHLDNLKISGKTGERFNIGVLVRSDRPELLERINRVIDTIPPQVRQAIYAKWVQYPSPTRYIPMWLRWLIVGVLTVLAGAGIYIMRLKRDLKHKKVEEYTLKEMAYLDNVTGVYSRAYVIEFFDLMWERAVSGEGGFGIIFFDIDNMKTINDRFGHDKGDEILHTMASRVERHLRQSDVIGRWGGDEFLIVLPDTYENELAKVVTRLENATFGVKLDDESMVSCSFGYATFSKGDTQHTLFKRADKRLYDMKQKHHAQLYHLKAARRERA